MCGIYGFNSRSFVDQKMMKFQNNRGLDTEVIYDDGNFSSAHNKILMYDLKSHLNHPII